MQNNTVHGREANDTLQYDRGQILGDVADQLGFHYGVGPIFVFQSNAG
jgi:hypothetical protein